jgi:hypothetical protein
MRTTREDAIRAKAYGVALEPSEDKDEQLMQLRESLHATNFSRDQWIDAFRRMKASREKWKRRWVIAFGMLLAVIVAAVCVSVGLWLGRG